MSLPTRALAVAAIGGAIVFIGLRSAGDVPATEAAIARAPRPTPSAPAMAQRDVTPSARAHEELVSYAVALHELHGLPPRAAPGTELELWVAWEPPVTKQPRIHRLLDGVILEEIAPPLLPDGPHVAMLLVRPNDVSDLLYGDRYGSLSVTIPQT